MKNITSFSKMVLPVLALITHTAMAQKLPSVQKVSMRAPANIKTDGQATEWDNKFQAYNSATDVAYTLSNDNDNLYLTIQAKYRDVVDKIIRGGITLTINHTLQKRDDKHLSITYPVLRDMDMFLVTNKLAQKSNEYKDAKGAAIKVDDMNELLQSKDKLINVAGIETITDPSISVYNTDGIKAASKFDANLAYTCEVAIPLKYLALPNNAGSFSYQIKVNETPPAKIPTHIDSNTPPPPPPMVISNLSTTDFWGEYTLAK